MYEVFILSMDGIASHHISWSPISQSGPVVLVRPNYWELQNLKIGKFPRLQLRYIRCLRRHNLTRLAHINRGMIFCRQKRPEIRNLSAWSASFSGPFIYESNTFIKNCLLALLKTAGQSISNFADLMLELLSVNRRSRNKLQVIKFQDSIFSHTYMRIAACSQGFFLELFEF